MHPDQIYNSAESVSEQYIKAFFVANGVFDFPKSYADLLIKHNGGTVHPTVSELPDEDSLFKFLPISPNKFVESVEKVEFDQEESSVPAALQPIFKIGESWDNSLYLSMAPKNPETFFLYSLSYDEFKPINGTISEFLNSLARNEPRADILEPDDITANPWNQVRLGNYDPIFDAIDKNSFDINSVSDDDPSKRTLLMLALQGCRLSLVKGLIERKADWNSHDKHGTPAIFYSRGFLEGLKFAEDSKVDLNIQDSSGNNLLHAVAGETESNISENFRCFDWLCQRVDRVTTNKDGDSPQALLDKYADQLKSENEEQPFELTECLKSVMQ